MASMVTTPYSEATVFTGAIFVMVWSVVGLAICWRHRVLLWWGRNGKPEMREKPNREAHR